MFIVWWLPNKEKMTIGLEFKKELMELSKNPHVLRIDAVCQFTGLEEIMKIEFIFAWYDLWIGAFWDQHKRCLYIFPVPCFGIKISKK